MANQITVISDETFRELSEPSDISIPTLDFWFKSNLGQLNSRLDLSILVVDNDFSPQLIDEEKDIYKAIYKIEWYGRQIRNNLGAAAYSSEVLQIKEGNRTIVGVNKNDIAKTFLNLRKDASQELNFLIQAYKFNRSDPRESKVVGDCGCLYDTAIDYDYYRRGIY